MIKIIVFFALLLLSSLASAHENYQYFNTAQNLTGHSGNIQTPSVYTLDKDEWSFGLHRFVPGINYGFLKDFEAGISFDLRKVTPISSIDSENLTRKTDEFSIQSKYRVIKENMYPLSITLAQKRGTFYAIFGKYLPDFFDLNVEGGMLWESKLECFWSVTLSQSMEQFIFDYNPINDNYSFGWRFLASPEMKLDFFMIDITKPKNILLDNFMFGITITGFNG